MKIPPPPSSSSGNSNNPAVAPSSTRPINKKKKKAAAPSTRPINKNEPVAFQKYYRVFENHYKAYPKDKKGFLVIGGDYHWIDLEMLHVAQDMASAIKEMEKYTHLHTCVCVGPDCRVCLVSS